MIRDFSDILKQDDKIAVTRCHDCKYYHETAISWCLNHDIPTSSNRFCSWAEDKHKTKE